MSSPQRPSALDRVRDHIEGRLSAAEVARLEAELAADPELAQFASRLRGVYRSTEVEAPAPPSSTTYAELLLRIEREEHPTPRISPRRVAVAAGLLLAVGAALFVRSLREVDDASDSIQFERIARPESYPHGLSDVTELPARLASFAPVRDGEIQWLSDLESARATARATGRLLWVFGSMPNCPDCATLRATRFANEDVLAAAEDYVPVEVDLSLVSAELMKELTRTGYPVLFIEGPEGGLRRRFSGKPAVDELLDNLWSASEEHDPDRDLMPWSEVRELRELIALTEQEELAGHLGVAWEGYDDIGRRNGPRAFGAVAERGLLRIAIGAAELALELSAAPDASSAFERLEPLLPRYSGTPFESDLRNVHSALDGGDAALPELLFAPAAY